MNITYNQIVKKKDQEQSGAKQPETISNRGTTAKGKYLNVMGTLKVFAENMFILFRIMVFINFTLNPFT